MSETNEITKVTVTDVERILIEGDIGTMKPVQRIEYYMRLCGHAKVDPLTRPFDFLKLSGKIQLYANKACTDQLRANHGVSITSLSRDVVEGCYVVTAGGTNAKGRTDMATGAVSIEGLKREALANAMMKSETKAKRRLTLSLCGLVGVLDESEIDSIQGAKKVEFDIKTGELGPEKPAGKSLTGMTDKQQELRALIIQVVTKGEPPKTTAETAECRDLLFKHSGVERVEDLTDEQIPDVIEKINWKAKGFDKNTATKGQQDE